METVKRVGDLAPQDVQFIERVFGQTLNNPADSVLILRVTKPAKSESFSDEKTELPDWCNVLDGLSDADLLDFNATLARPVFLVPSSK